MIVPVWGSGGGWIALLIGGLLTIRWLLTPKPLLSQVMAVINNEKLEDVSKVDGFDRVLVDGGVLYAVVRAEHLIV